MRILIDIWLIFSFLDLSVVQLKRKITVLNFREMSYLSSSPDDYLGSQISIQYFSTPIIVIHSLLFITLRRSDMSRKSRLGKFFFQEEGLGIQMIDDN